MKPFRMSVQAAYESKEHGKKGFIISGRIDGGLVKKGDKLILKPLDLDVCVKVSCSLVLTLQELYVGDDRLEHAIAGDIVDMIVTIQKEKDWMNIRSGLTLSSKKYCVPVSDRFLAEINIYDIDTPILKGNRANFHFGTQLECGLLFKLRETRNRVTGFTLRKNPRFLLSK